MGEFTPSELGVSATVEVTVYRHGALVHRELCETEEEAAAIVEEWSELDGVECQVDDLSVHHRPGDILEPEPDAGPADDDYRPPPAPEERW